MEIQSGRPQTIPWQPRDDFAGRATGEGRKPARIAAAILLLPFILLGAIAARMLKGTEPRVSGRLDRAEKAALRKALRDRLDALASTGTAFRLSAVLPFAWRRVHVIGAMEDVRAAFPDMDAEAARRLGSDRSDVLVILREPHGFVRIDLGTDHSLIGPGAAGLAGPDILVSPVRIAGVRHLRLSEVGG